MTQKKRIKLMKFSASRHHKHDEEIIYYYSSPVEHETGRAQTQYLHDAPGHFYVMEFNLQICLTFQSPIVQLWIQ